MWYLAGTKPPWPKKATRHPNPRYRTHPSCAHVRACVTVCVCVWGVHISATHFGLVVFCMGGHAGMHQMAGLVAVVSGRHPIPGPTQSPAGWLSRCPPGSRIFLLGHWPTALWISGGCWDSTYKGQKYAGNVFLVWSLLVTNPVAPPQALLETFFR